MYKFTLVRLCQHFAALQDTGRRITRTCFLMIWIKESVCQIRTMRCGSFSPFFKCTLIIFLLSLFCQLNNLLCKSLRFILVIKSSISQCEKINIWTSMKLSDFSSSPTTCSAMPRYLRGVYVMHFSLWTGSVCNFCDSSRVPVCWWKTYSVLFTVQ